MSVGIIPFFSFNQLVAEPLGLTYGRWVKGRRVNNFNQVIWSDDAINWTAATTGVINLYSSAFSPEQGLIVLGRENSQTLTTSTNSVIWTTRNITAGYNFRSIKWCPTFGANGLWVVGCAEVATNVGAILTSPDLINWTLAYTYPASTTTYTYTSIFDGEYFVVDSVPAPGAGSLKVVYTNDGVNFNEHIVDTISPGLSYNYGYIRGMEYMEGTGYILHGPSTTPAGSGSPIYFSTGLTASWTGYAQTTGVLRQGGATRQPKGATPGIFVVLGFTGGFRTDTVQYSYDGINFSIASFPAQQGPYDVAYSEEMGLFVYTNTYYQTYYTSEDGVIWTSRNHTFGNEYVSVRFCPGVRTTAYKEGADK